MTIPLCLHDDDASFKTDPDLELNIYYASLQKQQFTSRDATPLKTHHVVSWKLIDISIY